MPYVPSKFKEKGFNCPLCNAYAKQFWYRIATITDEEYSHHEDRLDDIYICICDFCGKYTIWVDGKMTHPLVNGASFPNPDMSDAVKEIYQEARGITTSSPRSACALLRLALEILLQEVNGDNKKDLFENIGILVGSGRIPTQVQKSMDSLRVTGNNVLHPAEIDKENSENKETAIRMFNLLNIVAKTLISDPKYVDDYYDDDRNISKTQKEAINNRDNPKAPK